MKREIRVLELKSALQWMIDRRKMGYSLIVKAFPKAKGEML